MACVYSYGSPLGEILIESDGDFLTGLFFKDSPDSKKHKIFESDYDQNVKNARDSGISAVAEACRWLDIYFSGRSPDFAPKFKIENLTPFRKLVVDEMMKIPFGKTLTYGEIAKKIAAEKGIKKMSAQAVGGAVGWNPICIIVPCHRVVGSNGSLTGYGGGIKNKIALLKIEGIDVGKFSVPKNSRFL
ncbi:MULTISPECIES: methylated-DNA--[protein]-cysteine S-methyltransferase [unclassified Treponema]|uniref:methylated-DNA--[protein]-cysteine S-methyltransferase n=1 Tax=unclassified Treponema TaxID=2638727 RepID=UPI0025DC2EDB|nr:MULTISPECIES: methylated-DNA--[protein]-cysteine S-methyltransferase [unclassified Treponema]